MGVSVEDHDVNCLFFRPGDHYHGLLGLSDEGQSITFNRDRALVREDLMFLTWEHPMVIGAIDQLLGSGDGRVSYGLWEDKEVRVVMLEAIFLLHCQAPEKLRSERFLPPTPLRILIDHNTKDISDEISHEYLMTLLKDDPRPALLQKPEATQQLLPFMSEECRELANNKKGQIIAPALIKMRSTLEPEIHRLSALFAANAPVREEEIVHLKEELNQLNDYINNAIIRLDSLRVIWRGPRL
jgi:ATP-dependent helicase HepA